MTAILIDALSLHSGGARTHLRELLRNTPGVPMFVLAPSSLWRDLDVRDKTKIHQEAPERTRSALYRMFWRRVHLSSIARALGASVYIDPAGGAPSLPIPRVTMVRNMLPFDKRAPEWYGRWTYQGLRLNLLRRRIVKAVAKVEGTIFVSRWSRETVQACGKPSAGLSTLISHGVDGSGDAPGAWPARPRWLYVSDIEPYKRQIETALAYDAARAQGAEFSGLTLVGRFTNPGYEQGLRDLLSRLRFGSEISLRGWLGRVELAEEMKRADGLLFSSSVECCPNILLEGLASGKPIVCSGESPMREFAEDAVVYADAWDSLSMAAGMRRVARMSQKERLELGSRGVAIAKRHSWKATAQATVDFLYKVASQGRPAGGAR